ncbi:RtcB family protein [Candidatus Nitrotoga sp. AM1P]|uniref:RtcB family protein n=1 Tax=Candidatus Nitrotoga sp. AM1P TaxID=2559597 RepID=UPI0010B18D07|nr:RtcB family protein [Candidatus Nitrotoga sp. AM1P]BBJ23065.1 hypothetical protein W01_09920 [Candidatus Nitrotoga sp. AM1P]
MNHEIDAKLIVQALLQREESVDLPAALQDAGQLILIEGSMEMVSYTLTGNDEDIRLAFGSTSYGAGRAMNRQQVLPNWVGR